LVGWCCGGSCELWGGMGCEVALVRRRARGDVVTLEGEFEFH